MTTNPLAKSSRAELQQRLDDARARLSAALDAEHAAVSRGDSDERIDVLRRQRENVQRAVENFERELQRRVEQPERPDDYAARLRALSDFHDGIAGRSGPPMHYVETVAGREVHHTLNTDDLRAIADMLAPADAPAVADAAARVLAFVSWFGDGEVYGGPGAEDAPPLESRDLETIATRRSVAIEADEHEPLCVVCSRRSPSGAPVCPDPECVAAEHAEGDRLAREARDG